MDPIEAYSLVFFDSFMSALLLPIQIDYAYIAMRIFGSYDMHIAALSAISGSTLAVFLNLLIGKLIRLASKYEYNEEKQDHLSRVIRFLHKKGKFGLVLVTIPVFGALYTSLLGFARLPTKDVLLWAILGNALFYWSTMQCSLATCLADLMH